MKQYFVTGFPSSQHLIAAGECAHGYDKYSESIEMTDITEPSKWSNLCLMLASDEASALVEARRLSDFKQKQCRGLQVMNEYVDLIFSYPSFCVLLQIN